MRVMLAVTWLVLVLVLAACAGGDDAAEVEQLRGEVTELRRQLEESKAETPQASTTVPSPVATAPSGPVVIAKFGVVSETELEAARRAASMAWIQYVVEHPNCPEPCRRAPWGTFIEWEKAGRDTAGYQIISLPEDDEWLRLQKEPLLSVSYTVAGQVVDMASPSRECFEAATIGDPLPAACQE